MGIAFEKQGRTPAELFKDNPDNLKIKLKPLRSEEANRDLLISFQVSMHPGRGRGQGHALVWGCVCHVPVMLPGSEASI